MIAELDHLDERAFDRGGRAGEDEGAVVGLGDFFAGEHVIGEFPRLEIGEPGPAWHWPSTLSTKASFLRATA
jgi:hypothetical protein